MDPNPQICLTRQHLQILQYTDTLFTRWSLRRNLYLFKHMKPSLQIPIFIIAQERRIAQITQSQSVIIQALRMSEFVTVDQQARSVKLVQLPTIRFKEQSQLIKTEKIVKNYLKGMNTNSKIVAVKPIQYIMSSKTQDGFYYLCLKTKQVEHKKILKQIIQQQVKRNAQILPLSYTQQSLYDDVKDSINKIRKNKAQSNNNRQNYKYNNQYNNSSSNCNNNESELSMPLYSRQNMMMMYPTMYYPMAMYGGMMPQQMQSLMQTMPNKSYSTFIRKAVDSDQEQNQQQHYQKQQESKLEQGKEKSKQILSNNNNNSDNNKQQQQNTNEQQIKQNTVESTKSKQVNKVQNAQKQHKESSKNSTHSKDNNNNGNNCNGSYKKSGNHGHKQHRNRDKDNGKQKQKQKQKQKGGRNKIVLDDNDFPSIG